MSVARRRSRRALALAPRMMDGTTMLRIHLLGRMALEADGEPLPFRAPPRTGPLLACLLLHRDAPLTRARAAALLWPDEGPSAGRANLRRHLHYLKGALPPGAWLTTSAQEVGWNGDAAMWLDLDAYDALRRDEATLPEAVSLYRGDLLGSWSDEWLVYERERWRAQYLSDLMTLIRRARSRNDLTSAIDHATLLLNQEPLREDVVRQLMALRYRTGDRAGALHLYERFATMLGDELGVEPMPDSVALYQRLLRNDPPPTPEAGDASDGAPPRPPTADLPLVGRGAELAQLTDRWAQAGRGSGGATLLGGEAGIGKTRLADELALAAEALGARVLRGATDPDGSRPYQPVVEALRDALPLIAAADLPPLMLAALGPLLPELQSEQQPPPLPPLDPERERQRLFESVETAIARLAGVRPLLIVFEDLHWAGESTLALIDHLVERASDLALLIVGSYRDEEVGIDHPLSALRSRHQRAGRLQHLALRPLDRSAISDLCRALEADRPELTEAADPLFARSEGNPLVVSALIQDWAALAADADALPQSVEAVLGARIERLDEGPRTLVGAAAVVGERFSLEVIRELVGWRESEALDALETLLDDRVIEEAGRRTGLDFRFRHRLLRDAAYRELPEAVRRRRHRRVGQLLEALHHDRRDLLIAELARHFDLGGSSERAAGYYLEAARHSEALFADREATTALGRGLELTDADALRAELLLTREGVLSRRGERDAQRRDLEALGRLSNRLDDAALDRTVLLRLVRLERALGRRDHEATALARLDAAAEAGGAAWSAIAHEERAHHSFLLGDFAETVRLAAAARASYHDAGDEAAAARTLLLDAKAAVAQGRLSSARERLDEVERLPALQLDRSLLFDTLRTANVAAMTGQDYDSARDLAERMLETALESGDRNGEADAHMHLAAAATRQGQSEVARDHYELAEAHYAYLRHLQGSAAVGINRGILDLTVGRYREAADALAEAEARFERLGDLRGRAVAALNGSVALLYGQDYAAAEAASERALMQARALDSEVFEAAALGNLGDAERNLGRLDEAVDHLSASVEIHRRLGRSTDLASSLCELGLALIASGRLAAAPGVAAELLALHDDEDAVLTHPQYALSVAAQVAAATGDAAEAERLHQRARETLARRLADLDDEPARERYRQLPINRAIQAPPS